MTASMEGSMVEIQEGSPDTIHVRFETDETVFRITDTEIEIAGVDYKLAVNHYLSDGEGNRYTAVRCVATHLETGKKLIIISEFSGIEKKQAMLDMAIQNAFEEARDQMMEAIEEK